MRPLLLISAALWLASAALQAEEPTGRYFPLDHRLPVGKAGRWQATISPGLSNYSQPVQVRLPSEGEVTFYPGSTEGVVFPAPAQASMHVGYVYRVKVSNLPEFPGVELYPTVELLDRMHPPAELKEKYPIPVELTLEEIEAAINDQMVTKVVYLEQPQFAAPTRQVAGRLRTEQLDQEINLLEAADRRGRPIAIVRIGGRVPDPQSPDELFATSPLKLAGQP